MAQAKFLADQSKEASPNTYRDVSIAVLDNYQGREQRIVLLSLVRGGSSHGHIGFVALDNRVCVALTRASAALFMFGHMKTLAKKSVVWERVERHLRQQNAIGEWRSCV